MVKKRHDIVQKKYASEEIDTNEVTMHIVRYRKVIINYS